MTRKFLNRVGVIGALSLAPGLGACSDDAGTMFETLQEDARFSTLVAAIEAAGLEDELTSGGPFTLFAPTNAAFDALPEGVLDAVLADVDLLTEILLYHVASGTVRSTDLSDGQIVNTLLTGGTLTIDLTGGTVQVGGATVTQADLDVTNGVVHVINAVLVPETN
jgi:uncharacterized surface protein with fasciclin (FAS1) repeats